MKLNLIILTSALLISCSSNNKSKNSNKENLNIKETDHISQPIPCDFHEKLSLKKLNNLWKKYKNNKEETVDYYYFDKDGSLSECSLKPNSNLNVSKKNYKYFFHEPDKIEIDKNPKEYIFTYLFNNFILNMRNSYTNEVNVFSKIDPNSKESQEVKSLCNF